MLVSRPKRQLCGRWPSFCRSPIPWLLLTPSDPITPCASRLASLYLFFNFCFSLSVRSGAGSLFAIILELDWLRDLGCKAMSAAVEFEFAICGPLHHHANPNSIPCPRSWLCLCRIWKWHMLISSLTAGIIHVVILAVKRRLLLAIFLDSWLGRSFSGGGLTPWSWISRACPMLWTLNFQPLLHSVSSPTFLILSM